MVAFQLKALRWGRVSQDGTYDIPEKTSIPKGSCETDLAGSHGFARNYAGTCDQDWHKSDTAGSVIVRDHPEVETPGASIKLQPEDVRHRMTAASALAEAIGDAHPDDAMLLMSAALTDLSHGGRRPDFFLNAEEEVAWWASCEPPEILVATLSAVLDNLGDRAMHLETRKRLFLVLWRSFNPSIQARFLAHASGGKA
jgi:hypothetical protein